MREFGAPIDENDDVLFDVTPGGEGTRRPVVEGPVDKTFRAFDPRQDLLLPPSLDEWLPADHLARVIADLVDEHLDLSRIHAAYTNRKGGPPFDPRLMVRVLLYGYTTGCARPGRSRPRAPMWSRFRWLAAGAVPDFRSVARFRKRHLSALGHLFVQALSLCQAAGMVSLGRVALDGTKLRANASRRKAMSYARMSEREKILAQEVSDLLGEAEDLDAAEDAAFGKDRRGDELLEELRHRESRLVKIREAKAALEQEARDRAEDRARATAAAKDEDDDTTDKRSRTRGRRRCRGRGRNATSRTRSLGS
ncbi:transposase [Leekyejoonella antrihumi]|uniref:transposase n=1 Tax=Leekyejoonella antrihumi TaxID=1660198 RepID=UPI003CCC54B3